MEAETTATAETTPPLSPNGDATRQPRGLPPPPLRPPSPARAKASVLGVEIGAEIASDGTLPLRCAADAIATARAIWEAACTMYAEQMAKVSPVVTEVAAQLKSRDFFFAAKQRSLKQADAALAEIRIEEKQVEERIRRATLPLRAQGDLAGAILAGEVRGWLRAAPEAQRLSLVERAIGAGDVRVVAAALEMPEVAGLTRERAALLLERWRRQQCPDELGRLELLQQTAAKVEQAAERLQRRFDEGYDHRELHALEASSARAA